MLTGVALALLRAPLTDGERRVVSLVSSGLSTAAAASKLGMSRQGANKLWHSAFGRQREFRTRLAEQVLSRPKPPPAERVPRTSADELRERARRCLAGNQLTPKQRVALERVAEHGCVRRAARECSVSAVTVHNGLRTL